MSRVTVTLILLTNIIVVWTKDFQDVLNERHKLVDADKKDMLGSKIKLCDSEQQANDIIMAQKYEMLEKAFEDPGSFKESKHFFDYKDEIRKTKLYTILKAMPKGSLLHAHDTGVLGPDYVISITYKPDLYVCFQEHNPLFLFSKDVPVTACETQWQLMRDARHSSGNIEKFDADLRKYFTIVVENPSEVHTDVNAVWKHFQQYFITTTSLFSYKPVWEQYFYDTLKACRDDNIMYLEIRSVLPQLYDLDGTVYSTVDTAKSYQNTLNRFKKDYPDFFGAKLIYAPLKMVDNEVVSQYLETAKELKKELGSFFAGFDLVGQEDKGKPLKTFVKELAGAADELDYFFHAGETNWYGTPSDENIFDAVALKTKRIGHAFAIVKHPLLIQEIKRKDIALEVNVISNSVLKLVEDVRNHPLASLLAMNLPIVIASDDPGVWEAEPLTDDYYVVFVGVASRHADLKLLKALTVNSILHSSTYDKDKLMHEFEKRWARFIQNLVQNKCTINCNTTVNCI